MKKILLATVAVVILASCSNNESEMLKNPANEIKFTNLNDRVTRVANDAGDDYQVYAELTTSASAWYINDVIDGTLNTAAAGPYYWPAGSATLDFFSYAPAGTTNATVSDTHPTLSITYTVPTTADEDFTVATPLVGLDENAGSGLDGTAEFQFEHMLSKITVRVSLKTPELSAYDLDLTNATADLVVDNNTGTLNAKATAPAFGSITGGTTTYSGDSIYMIMPQALSTTTTLQIKDVIITKNGVNYYVGDLKLYEFTGSEIPGGAFAKGTHYVFNFEITKVSSDDNGDPLFGPEIKFSADVTGWTTGVLSTDPIPQP